MGIGQRLALGTLLSLSVSCVDPHGFKFGEGSTGDEGDEEDESGEDVDEPSSESKVRPKRKSKKKKKPSEDPGRTDETSEEESATDEDDDRVDDDAESSTQEDEPGTDDSSATTSDALTSSDAPSSSTLPDDTSSQERERGPKSPGEACLADKECDSGGCRPVSIEWWRYSVQTRNCAECLSDDDCKSSGRGLACKPRLVDSGNLSRTHFACTQGVRGDLCEQPDQCGDGLVCADIVLVNSRLPELPFKTCGECMSDRDCTDRHRPRCRVNTGIPPELPIYNVCAAR